MLVSWDNCSLASIGAEKQMGLLQLRSQQGYVKNGLFDEVKPPPSAVIKTVTKNVSGVNKSIKRKIVPQLHIII